MHKEETNTQEKIASENNFIDEKRGYKNYGIFIGKVKKKNSISQMFMRMHNQHIKINYW